MNNTPWECPRCGTINAPFTPSCFCKKDNRSAIEKALGNSSAQYQPPPIPIRKDDGWLCAQNDAD